MKRGVYLGVDVGSVSTNLCLLDADSLTLVEKLYLRTQGQPIKTIQQGMKLLGQTGDYQVLGAGTTGSARQLAGIMLGADVVKNEITAHAVAASLAVPGVRTILEIGGQDSKIIVLRDDIVVDFAMNTVCAAGTGSFLDQQAARLGIAIEEFGSLAVQSTSPVRVAGRCTVFAESDMIHKQQLGHGLSDIVAGLCEAMVRNYLNNLAKGKDVQAPIVFQGGVAANAGMRRAFQEALHAEVVVPEQFDVMGAIGAALLSHEKIAKGDSTGFLGFAVADSEFRADSFICEDCPNQCEVVNIIKDTEVVACWGSRCGKHDMTTNVSTGSILPPVAM